MKLSTIILIACILLCSCEKNEGGCVYSSGLLLNTKWYFIDRGSDVNNDGVIEASDFASLPACQQDDHLYFNCDAVVNINDNANTCPGRPPVADEFFSLSRNDTLLYMRQGGYFIIKMLTPTQLHIRAATRAGGLPPVSERKVFYYEKR